MQNIYFILHGPAAAAAAAATAAVSGLGQRSSAHIFLLFLFHAVPSESSALDYFCFVIAVIRMILCFVCRQRWVMGEKRCALVNLNMDDRKANKILT